MLVRRTWIVVLLAAVFLMHGVPSMATDGTAVASSHPEMPAAPNGGGLATVAAMSGVGAAATHDDEPAGDGSPSHSMASHAWTACLAVLIMGIALLVAVAVRRLPALADRRAASRMHGSSAWVRRPRPPDLASLCLLRT